MYRYMKSSASESVRNACFNLEQFSLSSHLARIYFGVALIQTLNFHVPKLMYKLFITHFVGSLTKMSIILHLNSVQLELRSVSESVMPV